MCLLPFTAVKVLNSSTVKRTVLSDTIVSGVPI